MRPGGSLDMGWTHGTKVCHGACATAYVGLENDVMAGVPLRKSKRSCHNVTSFPASTHEHYDVIHLWHCSDCSIMIASTRRFSIQTVIAHDEERCLFQVTNT